jgi:uncharacterized protein (DUF2252 family)
LATGKPSAQTMPVRRVLPTARALAVRNAKGKGKALRDRLPRSEQGRWTADTLRENLVFILRAAVKGRRPELLPLRWKRMAASPFGFYRGAVSVMASDLGPLPTCGVEVQLCGDAHLLNLGAYGAPDGRLVFDLDDFDEGCRGPFEWDLKRLATSFVVGGRVAGYSDADCLSSVRSLMRAYREALHRLSRLPVLEVAREEITPRSTGKRLPVILTQAARDTPAELVKKATASRPGGYSRFRSDQPHQLRLKRGEVDKVLGSLAEYRSSLGSGSQQILDAYTAFDIAFRAVGTGSMGVDNYIVLLYGNGVSDPLFLQVKEEDSSCWRPYLTNAADYEKLYPHEGRRAAEGQLRTQTVTDPLLGWTRIGGKDFLVRQWSDHKARVNVRMLKKPAVLEDYATLCGRVLAKAHARTGDAAMLSGYCGGSERLDAAIAAFAAAYADQTERDHEHFRRSVAI